MPTLEQVLIPGSTFAWEKPPDTENPQFHMTLAPSIGRTVRPRDSSLYFIGFEAKSKHLLIGDQNLKRHVIFEARYQRLSNEALAHSLPGGGGAAAAAAAGGAAALASPFAANGGTSLQCPYTWCDYGPGLVRYVQLNHNPVFTGYMTGCLIIKGSFAPQRYPGGVARVPLGNVPAGFPVPPHYAAAAAAGGAAAVAGGGGGAAAAGSQHIFHVGTDNNSVERSRQAKLAMLNFLPQDATGFNPSNAWTNAEMTRLAGLLNDAAKLDAVNVDSKIFAMVARDGRFYSVVAGLTARWQHANGNHWVRSASPLNHRNMRYWTVLGIKRVAPMNRAALVVALR